MYHPTARRKGGWANRRTRTGAPRAGWGRRRPAEAVYSVGVAPSSRTEVLQPEKNTMILTIAVNLQRIIIQ